MYIIEIIKIIAVIVCVINSCLSCKEAEEKIMIVRVKYLDEVVGALAWDNRQNCAVFEFSDSFVQKEIDIAPITMPLADLQRGQRLFAFPQLSPRTFEGLPGLVADALPDAFGNAVLRAWLRTEKRESGSLTPLEKLSYVGKRAMGALEFEPTAEMPIPSDELIVERLLALTNKVLDTKNQLSLDLSTEEHQAMATLIRVGASAGGQRPKALIGYNTKTKHIRSGQVNLPKGYQYYLLKFDGVTQGELGDPKGYGRSELAYYHMAKACGIEMMNCQLLEENGRAHFMTKRFDRTDDGKKVHVQTLCALSHFDFNLAGAYDYEDAFEEMRAIGLPYPDMEQFFRRMVFNVVVRNRDDHTKNISFLMDENGLWRLSPAYDVAWSFNAAGEWTNVHQMTIGGKRDNFTRKDLLELGKRQGIKKAAEILDQTLEVVSRWEEYASMTDVNNALRAAVSRSHRLGL